MRNRVGRCGANAALAAAALLACSEGGESGAESAAERGRTVYQNICTACHHGDPAQDGSLGPAIAGSSQELLEAKVLRGEYPQGYAPKHPTAAMPKFEHLADWIPDLAAYLEQAGG